MVFQNFSQNKPQAYLIGDTFENHGFNPVKGDQNSSFSIESLKGKNVIIDLWDIHCSGCISGLKKLDSLQDIFPQSLKVICVTKNTKEEVEELFSRIKINLHDIPMIVGDTILYDYLFPHSGDPLHVWINPSGVIKYITGGYNTTSENIAKFMNNQPLSVAYQSEIKDFDPSRPLIEEASGRLKYYTKTYSVLTKGLQNVINTNRIEVLNNKLTDKTFSIKAINASILTLYQIAYNQELYGVTLNMFQFTKNNRISLVSPRADSLAMPMDIQLLDEWRDNNLYCYEISIPDKKSSEIYQWMQEDLNRFFDLSVSIRKKTVECLVLENIDQRSEPKFKSSIRNSKTVQSNNTTKYDSRLQMKGLVTELIYLTQEFNLPFVDGTNDKTNVSISFPDKIETIHDLNLVLKQVGLVMKREVREVALLTIL